MYFIHTFKSTPFYPVLLSRRGTDFKYHTQNYVVFFMKQITLTSCLSALALAFVLTPSGHSEEKIAQKCFYTGEPAKTDVMVEYEGTSYYFCSADLQEKFKKERADSLYQKIGGKDALDAAVELFYVKILADDRVSFFFDDVNMKVQKSSQKAFLATVLGAPVPWTGKDMRKAHANLDVKEADFNAIAENLQATLTELKLDEDVVTQIMTIVASTKKDVLNQ